MSRVIEDEIEVRQRIVAEALSWIGTPYRSNALVKGNVGGTDCAMLLVGVYNNLNLIPGFIDPRPYPAQWHWHRNEERYLDIVKRFANEVVGPPQRMPKPGDVVMFKIGKVFAHGAVIIEWPIVVHALGGAMIMKEDISRDTIGKRALSLVPRRFFSLWD